MEDLSRTAVRMMAAVALTLGLSATAACSTGGDTPVAPSPGVDTGSVSPTSEPTVPVAPGTGMSKPGIRLVAVPHKDGSFDITEDVLLPEALNILQVQLPDSGEHLSGMMVKTTPKVTNLKIVADDQPVPLEETTINRQADIPLTIAATQLRLTYRLSGSSVISKPSTTNRAGAAIRPISSAAEGTLPTSVSVTSGLLNAVCPLLTDIRCAVGDPPNLAIQPDIPASKALVVLQLNLPR
ncbi:hypothetical protein AB0L70_08980 [Kribbella sp. NPDC051952]|uniref:hypothetical protein n=1 Tax=Kribbella sp. NPDC051952 TaxID=3154851 RepID=UPI0034229B41